MKLFKYWNRSKFAAAFLVAVLCIQSCSKDNVIHPSDNPDNHQTPDVPKSSLHELSGIDILKSQNNNIAGDAYVYHSGYKYYLTLPLNSDLSNVFVNFHISAKAIIKIDGKILDAKSGYFNLNNTLEAEVTAENGEQSGTYSIMAQVGEEQIDQMIYAFIEKYNIPGASYAVAKNNKEEIVYRNACGWAVTETKQRATPEHLFRLGSMTKQHTAITVMKLIQDGKLGIDDLVFGPTGILKNYWPSVGPMSAQVTVCHLLEHTGGYSGDPMFSATYKGYNLDDRIQVMLNSSQVKPGTKFTYYNMGYGTLGKIIEVVSGQDYISYLKSIYAPAGVTKINLSSSSKDSRREMEAECYGQNGNDAYGNDIEVYKAAGGIIINTDELFKILYSVDGGNIHPDILHNDIRELMFTPSQVFSGYAKGWRTNHSLFEGYYHGGNLAGTATFWIYGKDYSVAILLNSRSYDDNFDTDLIVLTKNILEKASALFEEF